MCNCKFSVLVLQYNPIYELIEKTIISILEQKNIELEIVIADDGSKINYFEKIKLIFQEYGFENYILVENEKNQGTVKNIISGLKNCKGKYIKCISPGDYLYNPNVLSAVYEKMEDVKATLLFGDMAFYNYSNDEVQILSEKRPYYSEIYRTDDYLTMRKHLLIYQDNISGASAFIKRDIFSEMMNMIEDSVVFQEDVAFSMLTFMDEKIIYLQDYVVWYEYGGGISTSSENKWTKILQRDTLNYYYLLDKLYKNQRYVKRAILFQQLEMKKGIAWKIIKTILYPDRFIFRKRNVVGRAELRQVPEMAYLKKILRKEGKINAGY